MTVILDTLRKDGPALFKGFSSVYAIGSVLREASPNDIDLVLIYDNDVTLASIHAAKLKVVDTLLCRFQGLVTIHLTVLSDKELSETQFLDQVRHHRLLHGRMRL